MEGFGFRVEWVQFGPVLVVSRVVPSFRLRAAAEPRPVRVLPSPQNWRSPSLSYAPLLCPPFTVPTRLPDLVQQRPKFPQGSPVDARLVVHYNARYLLLPTFPHHVQLIGMNHKAFTINYLPNTPEQLPHAPGCFARGRKSQVIGIAGVGNTPARQITREGFQAVLNSVCPLANALIQCRIASFRVAGGASVSVAMVGNGWNISLSDW